MKTKAHVSQKKKQTVAELTKLVKDHSIIGIVDMENLPARQLQNMKEKLRNTVILRMSKKRLMRIVLENCKSDKKGLEGLEPYLKGMPAFIMSETSPFQLFKTLKKNKSSAPAKAGQIAPGDIKVGAGPTPFAPGPVIGELGNFGIKSKIENNKIVITEDKIVAKEGDVIDEKLAGILARLDIRPIEVGLNLTAIYEKGDILTKDVLDIDEEKYINDMKTAHAEALTLAVEVGYPNAETVERLIVRVNNDAKTLAMEEEIINDETKEALMQKAECGARKLNEKVPDAPKTEAKEVKDSPESKSNDTEEQTPQENPEDKSSNEGEKKPSEN
ncbi:MAG: 50S ribosomal protein L10 [Nanoarchaeota archaeon]|nr:50S ribosomal protein L10 [Nanoarchaeota archaeon]